MQFFNVLTSPELLDITDAHLRLLSRPPAPAAADGTGPDPGERTAAQCAGQGGVALAPGDVLLADALYANYWLIAELAAAEHGGTPRMLSFKHTVQLWSEFSARALCQSDTGSLALLFRLIAQQRVGHRPGRIEPRARKPRPKSFQWLKVPRPVARRRVQRLGRATAAPGVAIAP